MTAQGNFNCTLDTIPRIRAFLNQELQGLDEVLANQIVLAIEELFTNSILHGVCRDKTHTISIRLNKCKDCINIEFTDYSTPFPIDNKVQIDCREKIRNRERGGLGLYLIQNIMDEIAVVPSGDHYVIRLNKRF